MKQNHLPFIPIILLILLSLTIGILMHGFPLAPFPTAAAGTAADARASAARTSLATDWIAVDDPPASFWGNSGDWSASDGTYSGFGTGSLTQIYSYTAFNHFGDAAAAVDTMSGYRVRLTMLRPVRFSALRSRVVAGGKSTGAPLAASALVIDAARSGLEINFFGDVTWNGGNNSIAWYQADPAIDYGGAFVLELRISPENVEILVNGRSLFSRVPEDGQETGLFGLAGVGVSASAGVSFADISYAIDPPAVSAEPDVMACLSPDRPDRIDVRISGYHSLPLFQIWIRRDRHSDLTEGAPPSFTWILAKGFADGAEHSGYDESQGIALFDLSITPEDLSGTQTGKEFVCVFVRVLSADASDTEAFSKVLTVPCSGDDVSLSGVTINGRPIAGVYEIKGAAGQENLVIKACIAGTPAPGDTVRYSFYRSGAAASDNFSLLQDGPEDSYTFAVPPEGGVYTFRVRVCSASFPDRFASEKLFWIRVNAASAPHCLFLDDTCLAVGDIRAGSPLIFDLSSSVGGTGSDPRYRYTLGEPWETPILSQGFTGFAGLSRIMDAPGLYRITAYVSHQANTSYDDGLLRHVRVLRDDRGPIRGHALVREALVKVNGAAVLHSECETGITPLSLTASPGDLIEIALTPGGLIASGAEEASSLYRFSCWRLDAAGYRKVRSYSADPVFYFRPAAPGHYSLQFRVRGEDAKSYESLVTLQVNVQGFVPVEGLCLDLSVNGEIIGADTPLKAREAVTLTAQVLGMPDPDALLYRFDVSDSFLGSMHLKGFSPDAGAVWIPRKAGTYRIAMRCQDPSSMGFGDVLLIREVTVTQAD